MAISYQVLVNPVTADSIEAGDISTRNALPSTEYNYDNLEQLLSNEDNFENLRRHFLNKLSKRRAQAKANLAGLWGVPTRFAWMAEHIIEDQNHHPRLNNLLLFRVRFE